MSQKSILSFFKQADKTLQNQSNELKHTSKSSPKEKTVSPSKSPSKSKLPDVNVVIKKKGASNSGSSKSSEVSELCDNESPIKKSRKRKIKQIIDSDEESNEAENQPSKANDTNGIGEMDVDNAPETKCNEAESSPKDKKSKSTSNETSSSKKCKNEEVTSSSLQTSSKKPSKANDTNGIGEMDVDNALETKCNEAESSPKDKKSKSTSSKASSSKKCKNEEATSSSLQTPSKRVKLNDGSEDIENKIDIVKTDSVKISEDSGTDKLNKVSENLLENQPSTSYAADNRQSNQIIPKRKTARKSIKPKKQVKKEKDLKDSIKESESSEKENIEDCSSAQNGSVVEENDGSEKSNKTTDASPKKEEKEQTLSIKSEKLEENESEDKKPVSGKSKTIHPFFARKEVKGTIKEEDGNDTKIKEIKGTIKEEDGTDTKIENKEKVENARKEVKGTSKEEDGNDTKIENKEKAENVSDKTSPKKNSKESSSKKSINASTTSSGVIYDPSKSKYHPIEDACWKHNEKVPYIALAKTLELIENTSARLKIVEILSNFFRSVIVLTPEDLLQSVYLCLNRIAPEYEGIELGVGDMLLMKAVAQATGRTLDKIRAEVKEKGDLGLVAENSRGNQKVMFAPPKLTVTSVFSKFKEIAKMSGNASMSKKTDKIQLLFVACRDCEAKYIIRSLSGKLRIGLAEQSVLAALGRAVVMTPPGQSFPPEMIDKSSGMSSESFKKLQDSKTLILKTTYCECPNYDLVIPVLLKEGIDGLPKHCQLSPGCPLKPMLAHPTNGIDEVLRRFDNNEFTCEFKYDGERAQIHRTDSGNVKIFSRNQEDNTSKYPDVIARISKAVKETTKSFILDTEAVAWDREAKQILPFQVLTTRKKKDALESEIVVQVCIMAFDLLYLNGESLVKKTLKERRDLLHASFVEVPDEFIFAIHQDGNSAETMQEFLDESIKGNCEGLMVKALEVDASYEIAKRSRNWLKLKKDYLEGVGDTLDLVVIGGYHGKGKRTGNYGGFLLACYDNDNEEFQSICKLGTGFKEEELDAHTKFLKQHVIPKPKSYFRYDSSLEPDEWFEPVQTWEIKCADLSISPIHKAAAGIVDPEKGISLRFPRFLRIREDKKPEDATNSSQIAEMYQNQEQVQNMKGAARNEEDYY